VRPPFALDGRDRIREGIDTFVNARSLLVATNFFAGRQRLLQYLDQEKPGAVINLIPHIWTPLLRGAIQRREIAYITVVDDD
jgi:hypothetical protein